MNPNNMEITAGSDQVKPNVSELNGLPVNGGGVVDQQQQQQQHQQQPQPAQQQQQQSTGQPLIDFLQFLEDYKPSIPDSVTAHYMNSAGFAANDPRVLRLVSIASQKFIADIANDALQHCKMRTVLAQTKKGTKDKRYTLTFEDLSPTLLEHGIDAKKPQYLF
ncbi:Transcription initiation factor TFIID subunit 10 [Tyrophagus putrescentiae]|nr:Transcription initiation factor TFIID subunit 10 [Tyrophagus putrescentiae]